MLKELRDIHIKALTLYQGLSIVVRLYVFLSDKSLKREMVSYMKLQYSQQEFSFSNAKGMCELGTSECFCPAAFSLKIVINLHSRCFWDVILV